MVAVRRPHMKAERGGEFALFFGYLWNGASWLRSPLVLLIEPRVILSEFESNVPPARMYFNFCYPAQTCHLLLMALFGVEGRDCEIAHVLPHVTSRTHLNTGALSSTVRFSFQQDTKAVVINVEQRCFQECLSDTRCILEEVGRETRPSRTGTTSSNVASEVYAKRFKSKEVGFKTCRKHSYVLAQMDRKTGSIRMSRTPPNLARRESRELPRGLWSMSGNFLSSPRRARMHAPNESSFPSPSKYMDVVRQTKTNLDYWKREQYQ